MAKWYNGEKIRAINADIEVTYGKRTNGKSYDDKKDSLEAFAKNGDEFFYLRRRLEEIKGVKINTYFSDMHTVLNELFNGRYADIVEYDVLARGGEFYLIGYDKHYERHLFERIGYYGALVQGEYLKSASFPKVTKLTFEEFLTRNVELEDEFTKLQSIISTVGRNRKHFRVRLIGNTVNQNNQILRGMNIDPRKIDQGELKVYDYYSDKGTRTRVAVEYCPSDEGDEENRFFNFGRQREAMIVNGEWETDAYRLYRDLPENDITDQFVFTDGVIKVYVYVDANNLQMYVNNQRENTAGKYITFSTDVTRLNRNTFNWSCDYKPVMNVKRAIKSIMNNGNVEFSSYLAADDFYYITNGRL